MTIAFYIIFVLSIFFPIYTYAIYPLILYLLPEKEYKVDNNYKPFVSVIAFSNLCENYEERRLNIEKATYPKDKLEFLWATTISELNINVRRAKGKILIITDDNAVYDEHAISNLVKHFADEHIGCVCGQSRGFPSEDGSTEEGLFSRYENIVKLLESKIGCQSGANCAIYAVRKNVFPDINDNIINLDFYISTSVLQSGYDVIMTDDSVAYGKPNNDFEKLYEHRVNEGAGCFQSIRLFWRLLLPRKGSFVYVSHRIFKWLIPMNLIIAFVTNVVLSFSSYIMSGLLVLQFLIYTLAVVYYLRYARINKQPNGLIMKLVSILYYIIFLNYTILKGFCLYVQQSR